MSHEKEVLSALPQTPTIGRIVHFRQYTLCLPAIIVRVWNEDCADIQVFTDDDNGCELERTAGRSISSTHRTWHWPRECQ